MSRLSELLRQAYKADRQLGADLEAEFSAIRKQRTFGLVFEPHQPEAVELPGRPVRRGDKVRTLQPRELSEGPAESPADKRLWRVLKVERAGSVRTVQLLELDAEEPESKTVSLDNLVVVAEFRDRIYPGLVETGRVERGGDKPFHTVINSENYHALEMLTYTHRHSIDAIYIDPPYNSGATDWKYNNNYVLKEDDYRHSKWLAFMERRLKLARELLKPDDSVLIVTIDEKEYLRLGMLLEQTFPEAEIQMVSTQINPAASARAGAFGRVDEYIYFVRFGVSVAKRQLLSREWVSEKGRTHKGVPRWDMLRRSGGGARRQDSPGGFYPVYVDPDEPKVAHVGDPLPPGVSEPPPRPGTIAVLPIRKDGTEGRWMWKKSEFIKRQAQGRVRITGNERKGFVVSILKDGEYGKILAGEFEPIGHAQDGSMVFEKGEVDKVRAIPGTQWRIASHDSTQYGSRLLRDHLLPGREFPYPKSLYAVEDALRFYIGDKPEAVVLDFFAGSGTTPHAVMRLNHQDGGARQSISVTNNEVSEEEQKDLRKRGLRPGDPEWEELGICDYLTKPRITAAITGCTTEGETVTGEYKFTDEFPIADGMAENAVFFTLTYEAVLSVRHNRAFSRIAPMLWLRAGSRGRIIASLGDRGWDMSEHYAVLRNLDAFDAFIQAVKQADGISLAFIVTDDDSSFQMVCRELPERVTPLRLYESYLQNFEINTGGR